MQQQALLQKLLKSENLTSGEMESCMTDIMTGAFPDTVIAALLALLQHKGITSEELSGAYRSLMAQSVTANLDTDAVDTCGTGGDQAGTFNLSTIAAVIASGAGVPIAKHGNRSVTSRCGSADVLEELGFTIDLSPQDTAELFRKTGFAFLFAPIYHPSMKAVAHIRRELGIKTIFNALGPLVNPAGVRRQVIGIYDEALAELYINTLQRTGCRHALVVHGKTETGAGLDEASVCGVTHITELHDGTISHHSVYPEDFGLSRWKLDDLKGGDREHNAAILRSVLDGSATPAQTDASLYTAAVTCYVSGLATCIDEGMGMARESLESGHAARKLDAILAANREITARKHAATN